MVARTRDKAIRVAHCELVDAMAICNGKAAAADRADGAITAGVATRAIATSHG